MVRRAVVASLLLPLITAAPADTEASHDTDQAHKHDSAQQANSADYQKYMKQYAGGSSQGGDYQKYMKQYAGDSGNYQKYMKDYAGQSSKGSSQDSSSSYQKYMKQYAGGSSQGSSGYQKYYETYMKQYGQGSTGGYQKYIEQYGNQNQSDSSAVALYSADDAKTKSQLEDWKKSQTKNLDKYVPQDYRHYALESVDKQYKKRLHELDNTTDDDKAGSAINLAETPAVTLYSADQAKNKDQLEDWKKSQTHSIDKYVPAEYRHFATQNIDKQYNKRLHELDNSTDTQSAETGSSINLAEVPATDASATTLFSAGQAKNPDQLEDWKTSQTHSIDKYVPSAYRHYATQKIDKTYEKRLHQLDNSSDAKKGSAVSDYALNLEELPTHTQVNASAQKKELEQRAEAAVQNVEHIAAQIKTAAKDRAAIQKRAALPAQNAEKGVAKQRAALETEMASVKAKVQQGTVDKDDLQKIQHAEASIDALERAQRTALRSETHNAETAARHAARGTQTSARQAAREARKRTDILSRVASNRADELDRRAESAAEDAENYGEQLARSNEDELRRQRSEAEEQVRQQADRNRASLRTTAKAQKGSKARKDTHFLESANSEEQVSSAGSSSFSLTFVAAGALLALLAVLAHRSAVPQRTMPRVPEELLG